MTIVVLLFLLSWVLPFPLPTPFTVSCSNGPTQLKNHGPQDGKIRENSPASRRSVNSPFRSIVCSPAAKNRKVLIINKERLINRHDTVIKSGSRLALVGKRLPEAEFIEVQFR